MSQVKLLHKPGCGGVALLYDHRPRRGDALLHIHAKTTNGAQLVPGTIVVCGACSKPVLGYGRTPLEPEGGFVEDIEAASKPASKATKKDQKPKK